MPAPRRRTHGRYDHAGEAAAINIIEFEETLIAMRNAHYRQRHVEAPGEGFRQALAVLDGGRISIAALGLGTAIGAYETALEYAQQFGWSAPQWYSLPKLVAESAQQDKPQAKRSAGDM